MSLLGPFGDSLAAFLFFLIALFAIRGFLPFVFFYIGISAAMAFSLMVIISFYSVKKGELR